MTFIRRRPALLLLPIGALLLAIWTPSDRGFVVCPFRVLTGHACPGCGMTRALSYLLNGDWTGAVAYHPLAPVVGLVLTGVWFYQLGLQQGWWKHLPRRLFLTGGVAMAVSLLAVWVVRWSAGTLPPV